MHKLSHSTCYVYPGIFYTSPKPGSPDKYSTSGLSLPVNQGCCLPSQLVRNRAFKSSLKHHQVSSVISIDLSRILLEVSLQHALILNSRQIQKRLQHRPLQFSEGIWPPRFPHYISCGIDGRADGQQTDDRIFTRPWGLDCRRQVGSLSSCFMHFYLFP